MSCEREWGYKHLVEALRDRPQPPVELGGDLDLQGRVGEVGLAVVLLRGEALLLVPGWSNAAIASTSAASGGRAIASCGDLRR